VLNSIILLINVQIVIKDILYKIKNVKYQKYKFNFIYQIVLHITITNVYNVTIDFIYLIINVIK
jgi:hypothetical protein